MKKLVDFFKANPIKASIVSALLMYLAWPPLKVNFIIFIALVPITIAAIEVKTAKKAAFLFYICYVLFLFLFHFPIIIEGYFTEALLLGISVIPILWAIPIVLYKKLARKTDPIIALLAFPFLFLCQEVFQQYSPFPVNWFQIGMSVANTPWLMNGYIIFGQEGGTILILLTNVFVTIILLDKRTALIKHAKTGIVVSICVMLIPFESFLPKSPEKTLKVGLLQTTFKQTRKLENNFRDQIRLLYQGVKPSLQKGTQLDLIICPEGYFGELTRFPIKVNTINEHPGVQELVGLSKKLNAPILSGATMVELYNDSIPPTPSAKPRGENKYFDVYNGSIFITPSGDISWKTKQKLVPFAETIPFYKFFNWLESKNLWPDRLLDTYGTVNINSIYKNDDLEFIAPICFEGFFPELVNHYYNKDVDLEIVFSTGWTQSKKLLRQQKDQLKVNSRSFGLPLLFASTRDNSFMIGKGIEHKVAESLFSVESINISKTYSVYHKILNNIELWIVSLTITILVIILVFFLNARTIYSLTKHEHSN